MARRLSQKKRDEMFAKFCEHQSIYYVAKKLKISHTTAAKYRDRDNWAERLKRVQEKAEQRIEDKIAQRRARDLDFVEAGKRAWIAELTGRKKVKCPDCGMEWYETVPKIKASLRDIDALVRLGEFLGGSPDYRPDLEALKDVPTENLLKELAKLKRAVESA